MKKALLFVLSFALLSTIKAQFGYFATAAYIDSNGTAAFYNLFDQQPDASAIGSQNFQGYDLGTFAQNSGNLVLLGGQFKTFKNTNGNVCSTDIYYTVYPTGSRPASPAFNDISLGFLENCGGGAFSTGGPCTDGDQKWETINQAIDLTAMPVGTYTIEIYGQVGGTNDNNCGDATVYDNNNSNPTNYTATFSITAIAPVALQSFTATNKNTAVLLQWIDNEEVNSKGFEVERSIDGKNYAAIGWVNTKSNGTNFTNAYSYNDNDLPVASNVYYRLKIEDNNGSFRYSYIVPVSLMNHLSPMTIQLNGNTVTVSASGLAKGKYSVQLFSVDGKLLANKNLQITSSTAQSIQLQSDHLSKGVFIVALKNEAGELVSKKSFIR